MELTVVQLTGILVGIFFCYHTHLQFKKHVFSVFEFIMWLAIWGTLPILSIVSATLFPLATTTFLSYRLIDLVIVIAIIGLFAVSYITYKEVRIYQQKTKELVKKVMRKSS